MNEINRIKTELEELLELLSVEHTELEKVKDEIQQSCSEETGIVNNILGISKKIKALQTELENYLEE